MKLLRRLALAAFWAMSMPLAVGMSGRYWGLGAWLLLGVASWWLARAWRHRPWGRGQWTEAATALLTRPKAPLPHWQAHAVLPLWMPLAFASVVSAVCLGNTAMMVYLLYQCYHLWGAALATTAWLGFGLWLWRDHLVRPQGWRARPWYLLAFAGYFLMLALQNARFMDITMSTWGYLMAAIYVGSWLRVPPWLIFVVFSNTFFPTLLMRFYVDPMTDEVPRVTAQPGVRPIRSDPNLDMRWVMEGCRPGEYWMGTRKMMGSGPDDTTLQRNRKGFVVGGDTADNAVMDCRLHLLMVGDIQQYAGKLFVLDELTTKELLRTQDCVVNWPGAGDVKYPRDQGWIFAKLEHMKVFGKPKCKKNWGGITAVAHMPHQGWLFGSKENDKNVFWLDVRDTRRLRQRILPYLTTHMAVCATPTRPCLFTAYQTGVRRHEGPHLKPVAFWPRKNKGAGPTLALDAKNHRLYVSNYFTGDLDVLDTETLHHLGVVRLPVGTRFLKMSPVNGRLWAANFMNGWLYEVDEKGDALPVLFMGRKPRWMEHTRDGKGLLWCSAASCYEYRPGGGQEQP